MNNVSYSIIVLIDRDETNLFFYTDDRQLKTAFWGFMDHMNFGSQIEAVSAVSEIMEILSGNNAFCSRENILEQLGLTANSTNKLVFKIIEQKPNHAKCISGIFYYNL